MERADFEIAFHRRPSSIQFTLLQARFAVSPKSPQVPPTYDVEAIAIIPTGSRSFHICFTFHGWLIHTSKKSFVLSIQNVLAFLLAFLYLKGCLQGSVYSTEDHAQENCSPFNRILIGTVIFWFILVHLLSYRSFSSDWKKPCISDITFQLFCSNHSRLLLHVGLSMLNDWWKYFFN